MSQPLRFCTQRPGLLLFLFLLLGCGEKKVEVATEPEPPKAKIELVDYTWDEAKIKIKMSANPKKDTYRGPTPDAPTIPVFTVTARATSTVLFNCQYFELTLPIQSLDEVDRLIQKRLQADAKTLGGQVVSLKPLKNSKLHAHEFLIDYTPLNGTKSIMFGRVYYQNKRFYIIQMSGRPGLQDTSTAEEFLNSFTLVEPA